jgi:hypothetical protein
MATHFMGLSRGSDQRGMTHLDASIGGLGVGSNRSSISVQLGSIAA